MSIVRGKGDCADDEPVLSTSSTFGRLLPLWWSLLESGTSTALRGLRSSPTPLHLRFAAPVLSGCALDALPRLRADPLPLPRLALPLCWLCPRTSTSVEFFLPMVGGEESWTSESRRWFSAGAVGLSDETIISNEGDRSPQIPLHLCQKLTWTWSCCSEGPEPELLHN